VFLVRIFLAAALLPLDLLLGDAVRTGNLTRPVMGAFGVFAAYGAFRGAEYAMSVKHAISRRTLAKNGIVSDSTAPFAFRVRLPSAVDPCRLRGVPGTSYACAPSSVANVAFETETTRVEGDRTRSFTLDAVDLRDGARAFRVDGDVRASVDFTREPGKKMVVSPYATAVVVAEILKWQPQFAHGGRGVRAFLAGGVGGNGAAYAATKSACLRRSARRHRRAEKGEAACQVTLMDPDPAVVSALREAFESTSPNGGGGGGAASSKSVGSRFATGGDGPNRFVIARGDPASHLKAALVGSLDVIVVDARTLSPIASSGFQEADFLRDARAESFYREARRALRPGGVVLAVAAAPAYGPGAGSADLRALKGAMKRAFEGTQENAVETRRTGPAVPWFPQEVLVIATKLVDKERAARFNYN
jgi:SAM-dependent methyltransferase